MHIYLMEVSFSLVLYFPVHPHNSGQCVHKAMFWLKEKKWITKAATTMHMYTCVAKFVKLTRMKIGTY
jgi:hypothetical protein